MDSTITIAFAGSGKTTSIIDAVKSTPDGTHLCVTYTNRNQRELRNRLVTAGTRGWEVIGWYTFLVQHCIWPYLPSIPHLFDAVADQTLDHVHLGDFRIPESNSAGHYTNGKGNLLGAQASKLACKLNEITDGKVVGRIKQIWNHIYIDEFQDLAGYDLDLLILLQKGGVHLSLFGDHRQASLQTHTPKKHRQFQYSDIIGWVEQHASRGGFQILKFGYSYRCNQEICDLGHALCPYGDPPVSCCDQILDTWDGVIGVSYEDIAAYVAEFSPQALRYNASTEVHGLQAYNFGESKGSTFNRVLLFPANNSLNSIALGNFDALKSTIRLQLYIAVTRARRSCAFAIPRRTRIFDRLKMDCLVKAQFPIVSNRPRP